MAAAETRLASTVLWRIENLSSLYSEPDQKSDRFEVDSSTFALSNLGESRWRLQFASKNLVYYVHLLSHPHSERVDIECEWSLLNPDGSNSLQRVVAGMPKLDLLDEYLDEGNELGEEPLFYGKESISMRLRIWKRDSDFDQEERVELVTRMITKSIEERFVWRIEGFSGLQLNAKAVATVHLRGHPYTLCFFLTGNTLTDSHLNLSVYAANAHAQVVTLTVSVFGKETKCVKAKHRFGPSVHGQTWLLNKLLPRRRVMEKPSDWLVGGDILPFLCQFECRMTSSEHSSIERADVGRDRSETTKAPNSAAEEQQQQYSEIATTVEGEVVRTTLLFSGRRDLISQQKKTSKSVLLNDLMHLYDTRTLSDFDLRAAGGDRVPVHKSILCARSLFFREMLSGGVEDPESFDVSDLDADTLGMFLTFLYVGKMPDLAWEAAVRLYYAAGKYRVPTLRRECAAILQRDLNPRNVSEVFEMADKVKDVELGSSTFDFIENNFDAVVFTEEWGGLLERSYLAGKTMRDIYHRRKHAEKR